MSNHILLIEHEVKLARLIELELTDKGYQVSVAHDGGTGLKLVQAIVPTLTIVDLSSPIQSGLELCRQIRTIENTMPMILLTDKDIDEVNMGNFQQKSEVNACLVKPFSIEALLFTMHSLGL